MMKSPILHVDVDAFFASVEQVLNPALRGRPVVVGGGVGGRGVVASASYEARRFGLKAGMPIFRARELCPDAAYLTGNHEDYNRFAEDMFDILASVSPSVEQTSLDEAYVDLCGCERMYGVWSARPLARLPFAREAEGVYRRSESRAMPIDGRALVPPACRWAVAVALSIRRVVLAKTGLDVSVGVGSNRLVAKAASSFAKPSGVVLVVPGHEGQFVGMLDLGDVPGVGRATRERLRVWNVTSVAEAARLPLVLLQDTFGDDHGEAVFRAVRGQADPSDAIASRGPDHARSISRETTFWTPSNDYEFVESMLFYLTERLGRALRRNRLEGRTVQVKLRYRDFVSMQCSRSLGHHTDQDQAIFAAARTLLRTRWLRSRRLRLIGVGLADLRSARAFQYKLFDAHEDRCRRLDRCLDDLRDRFGFESVRRGLSIRLYQGHEAGQPDVNPNALVDAAQSST